MAEKFFRDNFEKYRSFVIKNPVLSSEIEVSLKWMSYIAAGRFTQSSVASELIHTVSNLITLVNDIILRKAANLPIHLNTTVEKLKAILSVIEYSEVFTEVAARQLYGKKIRWLIIVVVQLIKSSIRLLLVLKFKDGLSQSPPIPTLRRPQDVPQLCQKVEPDAPTPSTNVDVTFTLKRSGRVIRTLDSAPPLISRTWKIPQKVENNKQLGSSHIPTKLTQDALRAEILHLLRPLVHLISIGKFGETSWKPWLISLGMDATSLYVLQQNKNLNYMERIELNRRAFSFLVYLLRAPFYNKFAKYQIMYILKTVADNVPGSGLLLRPLMEYIPEWQQIYFYTWAI